MDHRVVTHALAVAAGVLVGVGGAGVAASSPRNETRINPCGARTLESRVVCLERLLTGRFGSPRPMSVLESRSTVRSWCDGLRRQQRPDEVGGPLNQLIENLRIGCGYTP